MYLTAAGTSGIKIQKRKADDVELPAYQPTKYNRASDIRHCEVNYGPVTEKNVHELFDRVRIISYDPPSGATRGHIHVLGVPRFTERIMRDMSLESLRQLGITNPNAKSAFMGMHFTEIKDKSHFNNTVEYLRRKTVIVDDDRLEYEGNKSSTLVRRVKTMKTKPKHSAEEIAEFREEYPRQNSWKRDCVNLRLSKKDYEGFMSLERQRQEEDRTLPIPKSDFKKVLPFVSYLKFLRELRNKMESHSVETGTALFLASKASTYKSTTCEILADSFGSYHIWPGTQFVKEDTLKYDSANKINSHRRMLF